ncbi:MAG: 16S rRNA (guanine(527)-N(7))-methyltransferase RsmG [Sulfitobacter sp.]
MIDVGRHSVSRETFERLESFVQMVEKWNPNINLISKSSVSAIWDRHIADSMQLYGLVSKFDAWVDIGSGGGFPGIVISILSMENSEDNAITMVESDQRKSAFLRTVIRELELPATVISERIEKIPSLNADVISARALADLSGLLTYASQHLRDGGIGLFPKGAKWREEHEEAQREWSYSCEPIKSLTDPFAAVLKIKDIAHA